MYIYSQDDNHHSQVYAIYLYPQVTVDDYRRYPFGGADDMATMFDFFVRVDQRASMDLTKKLNPEVQTFEQWVWSNSGNLGQALDYPSTPPGGPWQAV